MYASTHELLKGVHENAWFKLDGADGERIVTTRGGRQGCRLGGMVFNMIYAKALQEARSQLKEEGACATLWFDATTPFWVSEGFSLTSPTGSEPESSLTETCLQDVTYVDDEAAFLMHSSPLVLAQQVVTLLAVIRATFARFGFVINWAAGKTELMLKLRGCRATRARERLCSLLNGVPVVLLDDGEQIVHTVTSYRHVGGVVESDGRMRTEIVARISSASAALAKLRRPLANRCLPVPVRMRLVASLVWSRLLFGAASWTLVDAWCWKKLHAFYMQVLRQVAGRTWKFKVGGGVYPTDAEVLGMLDAPSIQCLVQQARLKALPSILGCSLPALGVLLGALSPRDRSRVPWTERLRQDLADLFAVAPEKLAELGCPIAQAPRWRDMIVKCPLEWKEICDFLFYQGTSTHADRPSRPPVRPSVSSVSPSVRPSDGGANLRCDLCPAAGFKTAKALGQHKRVMHAARCVMNSYVESNQCPACGHKFADRLRVIAHLSETRQRSKNPKQSCRDKVLEGGFAQLPPDRVKELDESAKLQRRAARKAGHTRPVVPLHLHAPKRPLSELVSLPKRRLRAKTSTENVTWTLKRQIGVATVAPQAKRPRPNG